MSQASRMPGRRRVLSTAQGSKLGPFGLVEWALLSGVALIWGSSFLLTEIGLESVAPPPPPPPPRRSPGSGSRWDSWS